MALGLGGIIAGIAGIVGASKAKKNIPAAPTIALTPQEQALQDMLLGMSEMQLEQSFADVTGGLSLPEYLRMQDALAAKENYDYIASAAEGKLKGNQLGYALKNAGYNFSDPEVGDSAWFAAESLANPAMLENMDPRAPINRLQVIKEAEKISGALLSDPRFSSLKVNVDGVDYPVSSFIGDVGKLKSAALKGAVKAFAQDPSDFKNREIVSYLTGRQPDQLLPAGSENLLKGGNPDAILAAMAPQLQGYTASFEGSDEAFKRFLGTPGGEKATGHKKDELMRTFADIGLYNPETGKIFSSFEAAVAANGGQLPETAKVQGLLAHRLQLEADGKVEEGKALDKVIETNFPAFHKQYFDPETGFYNTQTVGSKFSGYLDPSLQSAFAENFGAAAANMQKKIEGGATQAQGYMDEAGSLARESAQMIRDAVAGGNKTRDQIEKYIQDRIASSGKTKELFDAAMGTLDKVPGLVDKIAAVDPTKQLDMIQQLAEQATGIAGGINTNQDMGGPAAGKETARTTLQGAAGEVGPVNTSDQRSAADQLRQLATDPGIGSAAEAQRKAAMNQLDLSTRERSMAMNEQLAKRSATGSSMGDVQRAKLLAEVQGQQGDIEAKFMEESRKAREAEAGIRTTAAGQLGQLGTQMTGQELGRQQWNKDNLQKVMTTLMASFDEDTKNRLAGENLDLAAVATKLNAVTGGIEAQQKALEQMLGIPAQQAKLILETGQAQAGVGTAISQGQNAEMEGIVGQGGQFVNQGEQQKIDSAKAQAAVSAIMADLGDKAQGITSEEIAQFTQLAQAGVPVEELRLKIDEYNKTEPFKRKLLMEGMLNEAMVAAQGTINQSFGNRATGQQATFAGQMGVADAKDKANSSMTDAIIGTATSLFRAPSADPGAVSAAATGAPAAAPAAPARMAKTSGPAPAPAAPAVAAAATGGAEPYNPRQVDWSKFNPTTTPEQAQVQFDRARNPPSVGDLQQQALGYGAGVNQRRPVTPPRVQTPPAPGQQIQDQVMNPPQVRRGVTPRRPQGGKGYWF